MTTLWNLSDDVLELESVIEELMDSELEEEDKEWHISKAFEDWLEATGNFQDKAEKVAGYIKNQEALAKARREEGQRLYALAKEAESKADKLKSYLCCQMQRTNNTKIEGTSCKLSLRKKPAHVNIKVDYSQLPSEFVKVEYKPDKAGIKRYLKGNKVDWFAELEESGEKSLIIK